MKKYQIFALSTICLILANYWFIFSNSSSIPHLFDYAAYILFAFGLFRLTKKEKEN